MQDRGGARALIIGAIIGVALWVLLIYGSIACLKEVQSP